MYIIQYTMAILMLERHETTQNIVKYSQRSTIPVTDQSLIIIVSVLLKYIINHLMYIALLIIYDS